MGGANDAHPKWELYRSDSGREVVKKEIEAAQMSKVIRAKLAVVMDRVAKGEGHDGDLDNLGDGLREVRISGDRVIYRLLFSHERNVNVMLGLHYFTKTSRKTPPQAIRVAKERRAQWRHRQTNDS